MKNNIESIKLKFSNKFIIGRSLLLCPQCNFEYLHIIKTTVHRRRDKISIVKENISIKDEINTSRGVTITIEYLCESNHRGEIIFHFYKGNVEVYHRCLPPAPHDLQDIFRD